MDGVARSTERRLATWSARTFFRLALFAALLLIVFALGQGVTEVGFSGRLLLGISAALVIGLGLRRAVPRIRFRLRTLLIAMLVCGISLAWLGNKIREVREEQQILNRVRAGGFSISVTQWYSNWMPRWVTRGFGLSAALATGSLDCVAKNRGVQDEDLQALAGLRFCQLSVSFSNVTDDQIVRTPLPPNLKCFSAQRTALGHRALERIADCQNLEALEMYGTQVTDDGVAHLVQMPNLYLLGLEKTPLTDGAVKHLKQMQQLRVLRIWQTNITPEAMNELRQALPNCVILDDIGQTTRENYFYWPER